MSGKLDPKIAEHLPDTPAARAWHDDSMHSKRSERRFSKRLKKRPCRSEERNEQLQDLDRPAGVIRPAPQGAAYETATRGSDPPQSFHKLLPFNPAPQV